MSATPAPDPVRRFFDAFQEEAKALVNQKILSRDDASAIVSAFARIAASVERSERGTLSETAAPMENCFYCGVPYPKPVSYHHATEECRENEAIREAEVRRLVTEIFKAVDPAPIVRNLLSGEALPSATITSSASGTWIEVGTSDVPVDGNHVLVFSLWDKCVYTAYTQDGRWLHANGDGSDKYVIRNVTHWQDVPCAPDREKSHG